MARVFERVNKATIAESEREMKLLASRCLAYGVVIIPIHQAPVFKAYELFKIPDDALNLMKEEDLKTYVTALYLTTREMAGDWARGFDLLKGLGFERTEEKQEHRVYSNLIYKGVVSND